MDSIKYLDFDLKIERAGGGYRARVVASPAGEAEARFSLPYTDPEIENFTQRVAPMRRGLRQRETPEMQAAREFGARLFEALFTGELRNLFRASLAEAGQVSASLRLRLHLGEAPELVHLPWEFLYDPTQDEFLALSRNTTVLRYWDLPQVRAPLRVDLPLRILAVIAAPTDGLALDAERERANLQQSLRDLEREGLVKVDFLDPPTLLALQRHLPDSRYHIFHFLGQASYDEETRDGILYLEDERRRGRPTGGQFLGALLYNHPAMQLAVLNAGEGSRTARIDPFAATAHSLIRAGIPAVIAMQFEATAGAGSILARALYRSLAEGQPVDTALATARKTLFNADNDLEWGTPALYLRTPDGAIFDLPRRSVAQGTPPPTEERATRPGEAADATRLEEPASATRHEEPAAETHLESDLEERLKEWYLAGYTAYREGNWEQAAQAFERVVRAQPDYRNAARVLAEARRRAQLEAAALQAEAEKKRDAWDEAEAELDTLMQQQPSELRRPSEPSYTGTRAASTRPAEERPPVQTRLAPAQPAPVTDAGLPPPVRQESGRGQRAGQAPRRLGVILWGAAGLAALAVMALALYIFVFRPPELIPADRMVRVNAGPYRVGDGQQVELAEYWIDQYEVTNREYAAFLEERGGDPPSSWGGASPPAGKEDHPVQGVTWAQATAYCRWAGKRLPTEAEWEAAARGPYGWLYPWGNNGEAVPLSGIDTHPVGSIPANRSYFGTFDMTGNVWEWVGEPYQAVSSGEQVIRGGAYDLLYSLDYRLAGDPSLPNLRENTGFRCAADGERVDPQQQSEVIFVDSFADPASGWPEQIQERFIYNYHPVDWYHLQLTEGNMFLPVFYDQQRFDTFILETDVYVDAANTDNTAGNFEYGLAIQHQPDAFYAFVISAHTQEWRILQGRLGADSFTGPLSDLTMLDQGSGTTFINGAADAQIDRLAVIAGGSGFTFSINGQLASRVEADDFTGGTTGMIAIAGEGIRKVHIHYDRFSVQPIDPEGSVIAATGGEGSQPTPAVTATGEPAGEATEEPAQPTTTPEGPVPVSRGMVKVDSGTYQLGPGLSVALGEFWIDRFEVTNREFQEFVDRTGAEPPAGWSGGTMPFGKEEHPVRGVTWAQANAYCAWVDKRLPNEAEWEAAARGPYGWLYPWGDDPAALTMVSNDTYPVGSEPENRSYFGAFDMAGNVWEWVQEPYLPVSGGQQVIRGGAYNFIKDMLERLEGDPESPLMTADTGFRCAANAVRSVAEDDVILEDDFSDVEGDWFQAAAPAPVGSYFFGYHPTDFYHLQVDSPEDCLSVIQPTNLDDYLIEVEMFTEATESEEGSYGFGMVLRESENRFYALVIYPRSQRWQVLKSTPQGMELMAAGSSEAIEGDTRNTHHRLYAVAHGPQMSFFTNGQLVARLYDEDYPSGNIGFIVMTEDETYMHAHYDQLHIWRLPSGLAPVAAPEAFRPSYDRVGPVCRGTVSSAEQLDTFITHQVAEGETWIEIAARYNLTVEEVMAANGRSPERPGTLLAGAALVIPAGGAP